VLVARFSNGGDELAFRELYRLHTPLLYRISFRILGSESDAQDAVQEAWLRAAKALNDFRWESKLSTWLAGIALNCCRERMKAARRESPDERPSQTADAIRSSPALRMDLERALQQIAPGYREVIVLHDVEGYTHQEIAAMLAIEEGTSKSQLSRARSALRGVLESD
jgi:RNA polymerase sigma-70 factor (ECF subfamily)